MSIRKALLGLFAVGTLFAVGCSTEPTSEAGRAKLDNNVEVTTKTLYDKVPGLQGILEKADAYVFFPTVGKGGLVVGGAFGRGQVYEHGKMIGYADITQASIGAQIGGQTYTEVIAFETDAAFQSFKRGELKFAAQVSAVILKSGEAANAKYTDGVAVFTYPKEGAMAEAAVGGQQFKYVPADAVTTK